MQAEEPLREETDNDEDSLFFRLVMVKNNY